MENSNVDIATDTHPCEATCLRGLDNRPGKSVPGKIELMENDLGDPGGR
jgi:hypothetical protein